jgi:hypothetical protein
MRHFSAESRPEICQRNHRDEDESNVLRASSRYEDRLLPSHRRARPSIRNMHRVAESRRAALVGPIVDHRAVHFEAQNLAVRDIGRQESATSRWRYDIECRQKNRLRCESP